MTKLAAIEGQLVSIKNVSTHKSACLTIHVPEEYALKVIEAFGWPTMAAPVPVAIARLDPNAKPIQIDEESPQAAGGHARAASLPPERRSEIARNAAKRRWHEISLSQQAGILCGEGAFNTFLEEKYVRIEDKDTAAIFVRNWCGVESRSELDQNASAAIKFNNLKAEYEAWKLV